MKNESKQSGKQSVIKRKQKGLKMSKEQKEQELTNPIIGRQQSKATNWIQVEDGIKKPIALEPGTIVWLDPDDWLGIVGMNSDRTIRKHLFVADAKRLQKKTQNCKNA